MAGLYNFNSGGSGYVGGRSPYGTVQNTGIGGGLANQYANIFKQLQQSLGINTTAGSNPFLDQLQKLIGQFTTAGQTPLGKLDPSIVAQLNQIKSDSMSELNRQYDAASK